MQGVIGWWMVKSGLVDRPDVSHLRLTTHLGMAFLLYVLLLWTGLTHLRNRPVHQQFKMRYRTGFALIALVYTTVLSGGLVAGLNAGAQFNTFPLMAGQWIPDGLYYMEPWYANIFENMMTIQFNHRYVAMTTGFGGLFFYLESQYRHREKWKYCSLCNALYGVSTGFSRHCNPTFRRLATIGLITSNGCYCSPHDSYMDYP